MYSIKEVCAQTGLTPKAVRYYDKVNLLNPSCRTKAGYRLYTDSDITVLRVIVQLRAMEFGVGEIRTFLASTPEWMDNFLQQKKERLLEGSQKYFLLSEKMETILQTLRESISVAAPGTGSDRAALLVINMQNDFLYGPLSCPGVQNIIPAVSRAVSLAEREGVPVIFLCDSHQRGRDAELAFWGEHAIEGTPGAAVIDPLPQTKNSRIVKKTSYSGFWGTVLQDTLSQYHARHVVLCGVYADLCIHQTLLDAYSLGYSTYPLGDAIAAKNNADPTPFFKNWEKFYGSHILIGDALESSGFPPAQRCASPQEAPDFDKTRAVQPTEVPETTFLGELIGWTEHLPHQANHEEKE